jgi:hypothetical protein
MKKSARRKTDANATGRISLPVQGYSVENFCVVQRSPGRWAGYRQKALRMRGLSSQSTVKPWQDMAGIHSEERALARVSKDGSKSPWFETPRRARLLTMTASMYGAAKNERPARGDNRAGQAI